MRTGLTGRHRTESEQTELVALIWKRRDEGLGPKVIAERLSLPLTTITGIIQQGRPIMANSKIDYEKVSEALTTLRGMIRKLRGGMQTHEVQDTQVAMVRIIDTVETEVRIDKTKGLD